MLGAWSGRVVTNNNCTQGLKKRIVHKAHETFCAQGRTRIQDVHGYSAILATPHVGVDDALR